MALPSSLHLLKRPSNQNLIYALSSCSLAFFLFSFQVHEKSILLPLLPITLLYSSHPGFVSFFMTHALFSLHPLLIIDKLELAYLAMLCLTTAVNIHVFKKYSWLSCIIMVFCYAIMGIYHYHDLFIKPPQRYPDLYVVGNCIYNASIFIISYLYLLYLQFCGPEVEAEKQKRE